jgi:hypothetical protein
MNDDDSRTPGDRTGLPGDPGSTSDDRPAHDPVTTLLRLLVGGAAEGTDAILTRLYPHDPADSGERGRDSSDDTDGSHATLARHALIGLLFEAHGTASRGASAAGRLAAATGRFWGSVLDPVLRSRVFDPVRLPSEYLLERGARELERWARVGRVEEQRSREVARRIVMTPVEDIVAYLRTDPELARLVSSQAQTLLDELADDPSLTSVIRSQGDRYVDHLQENPEAVQELVRGQSAGLAEEVANSVRQRTVSADILLERFVRTLLRRRPRRDLPDPPREVQEQAQSRRTRSDEHE